MNQIANVLRGQGIRAILRVGSQLPVAAARPGIRTANAEPSRLALDHTQAISCRPRIIEAARPAIQFTASVSDVTDCMYIGKIAKVLGYETSRFFERLRADLVLMKNNIPYQEYLDGEYFKLVERNPGEVGDGCEHLSITTLVTGKGQVWLARRYPPTQEVISAAIEAKRQQLALTC